MKLQAKRIVNIGSRPASLLEAGEIRVVIEDRGGMVPELSHRRGKGYLNAHWMPSFRSNSGEPFEARRHGDHWGAKVLYQLAGNFPCLPNFGPACTVDGISYLAHGHGASDPWENTGIGRIGKDAVYARSQLRLSEPCPALECTKIDLLIKNQPAHYAVLDIANRGSSAFAMTLAWHNTLGAPFLESGSLIDLSAARFSVNVSGTEFDATGRLEIGAQFDDLEQAPLRGGGTVSLRRVPGMIGYTDFITGAIPSSAELGWSSVVNPGLSFLYLCFFRGPASSRANEITLGFNDLWMQYGGRPYPPWAGQKGGADTTFCLGTENAVSAFANGLAFARKKKSLLGAPTTVSIPAGKTLRLYYGTLFAPYSEGGLANGVEAVSAASGRIEIRGRPDDHGRRGTVSYPADPRFERIEALLKQVG